MSKAHPGASVSYARKQEIRNARMQQRNLLNEAKRILEERKGRQITAEDRVQLAQVRKQLQAGTPTLSEEQTALEAP